MNFYNDASLITYPSGYKSGVIYSQKPTDGSGDLTFTRASTATRVNESGLIESVASGVPRIDYTGGGCGKFLFEPQRTNLFTYSEDFTDASWTKTNISLTTSYSTSFFEGKQSTLITTTSTTACSLSKSISSTNNNQTFFVKKVDHDFVQILNFGSTQMFCNFDLENKTVGTKGSSSFTGDAEIKDLGNGWLKISVYFIGSIGVSRLYFVESSSAAYGGGAVSIGLNLEIGASQSEEGNYPTSYIPTAGATATRLQDAINEQIVGFTTIGAGTFFLDFYRGVSVATSRDGNTDGFFYRSAASFPSASAIEISTDANGSWRVGLRNGSFIAAYTNNTLNHIKVAIKWDGVNIKLFVNGVLEYDNPFVFNNALQYVGYNADFKKEVQNLMLFPTALTDTDLATLTTI